MDIRVGRVYPNKTWRFLTPCLRWYEDAFLDRLNKVFKLAVGIYDYSFSGASISNGQNLYILIDTKYRPEEVLEFFNYIRYQDYFITDYCPEADILNSRLHIVVISLPAKCKDTYFKFLSGHYSEMYDKDTLNLLFSHVLSKGVLTPDEVLKKEDYEILSKSPLALSRFVKKVNKEFDVDVTEEEMKFGEYELPLKNEEEIFNYEQSLRKFFSQKDKLWI